MRLLTLTRQQQDTGYFILGLVLAVFACGILASHAALFSQKRDTAVMIGTQLPELKSAVALLAASVAAEQFFTEQALAAREEQASVYILPESSPGPRIVRAVEEMTLSLGREGTLTFERLTFDPPTQDSNTKTLKGRLTVRGSLQNMARLLTVLGFGGDMMVRDVLSAADQATFLRLVEALSPLSLKAAEDFLYLDLVEYALDPDGHEQRMLSDVPTDAVPEVRAHLLTAGLSDVRAAFSGVAASLKERNLWPIPLFDTRSVVRDGVRWTVEMVTYGR